MKGRDKSNKPGKARETPRFRLLGWAFLAAALLVGLGLLVERLTRPAESMLALDGEGDSRPNNPRIATSATPPPAVHATVDELAAEGKRLAEEIAVSFSGDADALAMSGRLYYSLGSATKAVSLWEQSLELNRKTAEAK